MKRRSYARRRDANEPEIVKALKGHGCKVERIDQPADLRVWVRGASRLLEVKDGRKAPSDRPLTPGQRRAYLAAGAEPLYVVRSVEEALCVIGAKPCRAGDGCGCGGIDDPPWFVEARKAARALLRERGQG